MADDVREEDEWLYGESDSTVKQEQTQEFEDEHSRGSQSGIEGAAAIGGVEEREAVTGDKEPDGEPGPEDVAGVGAGGDDEEDEEDDDEDEDSDDDDDDGVQVTIGEIKATAPTPFGTAQTKRSGPPPDKKGKFSVEDFESPGTINGVPALDFNIDSVEDKPWRKPGADITDYFNYGFSEDTWRAYCDRQKRMRFDAGGGGPGPGPQHPPGKADSRGIIAVQINDNSKYGGSGNATIIFPKKFGMNPMRNKEEMRRREEPKENTIQVMTADRREYSRKNFDMPPPPHVPPPFGAPPFDTSVPPPPFPPPGPDYLPNPEYFNHPPPPYYHEDHSHYEEQQWMEQGWDMNMDMSRPPPGSAVVSLTKASNVPPPPGEGDTTPPQISSIKEDKSGD